MANVISSAIVNTPPAEAVSNVLSKRNTVHHLDDDCDETQIPLFTHDVTDKKLNNPCLLPRRNWCSIAHTDSNGALEVSLNVEIDQSNHEGRTKPYLYHIPLLDLIDHPKTVFKPSVAQYQSVQQPVGYQQPVQPLHSGNEYQQQLQQPLGHMQPGQPAQYGTGDQQPLQPGQVGGYQQPQQGYNSAH